MCYLADTRERETEKAHVKLCWIEYLVCGALVINWKLNANCFRL